MNPIQIDLIDRIVHEHQEALREQAAIAEIPHHEPHWRQVLGDSLISIGERISGHRPEPQPVPAHPLRVS